MKAKNILLVVVLLVFVIGVLILGNSSVTGKVVGGGEEEMAEDVIQKRTYNTKTFENPDGSFTAQIGGGQIYFFDGEGYVELEKFSSPLIDKKIITLDKIPKKNIFDFGTYELYKGVEVELSEEGDLFFVDANNKLIRALPRPFSTDVNGEVSMGDYVVDVRENEPGFLDRRGESYFEKYDRVLELGVRVDERWLKGASYPVVVDPTVVLDVNSGIYDGDVNSDGTRDDDDTMLSIGVVFIYPIRAFIDFNTSSIPDTATIGEINLTLIAGGYNDPPATVDIGPLNGVRANDSILYPNNVSGNTALFNDLGTYVVGSPYVDDSTAFQVGIVTQRNFTLGSSANIDLQNNLTQDFFTVGFVGSDEDIFANWGLIVSSESPIIANRPSLQVTYTLPLGTEHPGYRAYEERIKRTSN